MKGPARVAALRASEDNQRAVFEATLARLTALHLWGMAFAAVREPWKARPEGPVGPTGA
jgi:hypothetical protein